MNWEPATAQCPCCHTWWRTLVRVHLGVPLIFCPICGVQRWRAVAPGGHTTKRED